MFSQRIKSILLTALHSLFTIFAVYLIVALLLKIEYLNFYLSILITTYVLISIIIRIIRDIYFNTFPQFLLFLIAFTLYYYSIFASHYFTFSLKYFSNSEITYLNSIFVIYLFFDYLIFKNLKVEKTEDYPFKFTSKWNYIVILFLIIFILIFVLVVKNKFDVPEIVLYSSSFLLAINPFFNRSLVNLLQKKTKNVLTQLKIDASFYQIGLINTIKTFVFPRKGFIGKQQYELRNVEHRKTLRKDSVLNIAVSISKLWKQQFSDLFFIEIENKKDDIKFEVLEKSENGIIVRNGNYGELVFGFYSFISKFTDAKNTHNLYLLRNKLVIGKFEIKEDVDKDNLLFADKLNKYGNTVLINNEKEIDFNENTIVFDRTYFCKNTDEEIDILQKLNSKAPTTFFNNNTAKIKETALKFVISEIEKNTDNDERIIYINKIKKVEDLMIISKKVHNSLNYALLIFVLLNLSLLIFTVFFYKEPLIILSVNLTLSVIYVYLFKYLPLKF